MGLFGRKSRARGARKGLKSDDPAGRHLREFFGSRRGVEGYVEPATHDTGTTLILIAFDGEWTRRAIDSPRVAFALGQELSMPVYDVSATGYPNRMREWSAQNKPPRL